MTNSIIVNRLVVSFGSFKALDNISFSFDNTDSGIVGLIGPNGAGKTTLIHTILGLEKFSEGEILSKDQRISYCPDTPEFEPYATAEEILLQSLFLSKISLKLKKDIKSTLNAVGLSDVKKRFVGTFSRGMKQRLGIAAALILKPNLLFLDEPTSALDPFGRKSILSLISQISKNTKIIISSHALEDIQKVANSLLVLDKGKLIFSGSMKDFIQKSDKKGVIQVIDEVFITRIIDLLKENNIQVLVNPNKGTEILFPVIQFSAVLKTLSNVSDYIKVCKIGDLTLYDAFEKAVKNDGGENVFFPTEV